MPGSSVWLGGPWEMAAAMWVGDSGVSLRRHINPFTCRPNFRRSDDKPVHCCPAPSAYYWPRCSLTISCGAPVHRTCVRGCEGMGVRGGGGVILAVSRCCTPPRPKPTLPKWLTSQYIHLTCVVPDDPPAGAETNPQERGARLPPPTARATVNSDA